MPLADGLKAGHIQLHVLALLSDGPLTLGEMQEQYGERPTRTALVHLERRGLVTGTRTPGRQTMWALTEEES